MARKTTDNGSATDVPVTIPAYSMWCIVCGENMQFDEVPANRLLKCPSCSEMVMAPDSLGNEQAED